MLALLALVAVNAAMANARRLDAVGLAEPDIDSERLFITIDKVPMP